MKAGLQPMDLEPTPVPPSRFAAFIRVLPAMALTLAIGTAGGVAFWLAGAPAAFLTGSAVAITIAVTFRLPTYLPDRLRQATFSILGVVMGAGITPDAVDQFGHIPIALIGLVLVIGGATFASYHVLRRVGGWDPLSALCGSIPGNFSLVLAVSLDRGANIERVVMAQSVRLFILVALVPFVLGGAQATGMRVTAPPGYSALDVALTLAIAFASATVAQFARIPAGGIIGPLIVSAVLSGAGIVTIAIPAWLGAMAFIVLGASIAVRFATVGREGLRRMLIASLASFVAAFAVAFTIAAAFAWVLGVPIGAVFLAYAPGGLDAMIALSFLLHYEVAFVAVLHTARMLILAIGVPIGMGIWSRRVAARDKANAGP